MKRDVVLSIQGRQRYGEQVILRASALGGAALGGGLDPSRRTGVTKPLTPEAPV